MKCITAEWLPAKHSNMTSQFIQKLREKKKVAVSECTDVQTVALKLGMINTKLLLLHRASHKTWTKLQEMTRKS